MTTEKGGLAYFGEMLRFFGTSLATLIKCATGAFEVAGQARKTDWIKSIRIPYWLNFEQLIIAEAYITRYWLRSSLPRINELQSIYGEPPFLILARW
jgi:hypothetical protein